MEREAQKGKGERKNARAKIGGKVRFPRAPPLAFFVSVTIFLLVFFASTLLDRQSLRVSGDCSSPTKKVNLQKMLLRQEWVVDKHRQMNNCYFLDMM